MKPLISVIIPVYMVENFLECCIRSVICQTYKNLEIILVDDGSPDNCSTICDKYAALDSRIIVIHKKNNGAGSARNDALKVCKGDFISFVDSDDYISKYFYEYLLSLFEDGIDIAECEYGYCDTDNFVFDVPDIVDKHMYSFDTKSALKEHINNHYFQQVIWNKLYRRNVVQDFFFPENTSIDDEYWTYKVISKAKKLVHSNLKLYAYRQQDLSISHTLRYESRKESIIAKTMRHNYLRQLFPELLECSSYSIWCSCVFESQLMKKNSRINYKEMKSFAKDTAKKYRVNSLLRLNINIKYKVWYFLSRISWGFVVNIRNLLGIGL